MKRLRLSQSIFLATVIGISFLFCSSIASASTVATPTFSPGAGTYTSVQTVTISDSTSGATIYYTTNGSTPTTSSTQYTGPISVGVTETVKAIGAKSGWTTSAVGSAAYTINLTTATPTFSPAAGTYTGAQTVTISDSTSGSTIYYTTNGSTPTTSSTQYTSPISVNASETVKAIATATGYAQSAVGSAAYTLDANTPTFSPAAGTYTGAQTVTISDSTSGSTIYYTTNGSTPTTSSTQYTSPISVSASETVKAIATATGYSQSAVGSAAYTLDVNTPTFSPAAGTYVGPQTVTISDATSGATIYYTTNGTTPTTSSTQYTSPITVSASETVKAIATATGYSQSAVGSAAYTLDVATPTFSPGAGTYTSSQTVTISDTTSGSTIYYTTNGSTPTTGSTRYTGPITVNTNETLKAIAAATGLSNSAVASAVYSFAAATPTFSPVAGSYGAAQSVTLSDSTTGATIYYTTNGTTPTTSSTRYTAAIPVSSTETVEAIAAASGYSNSTVGSATYVITTPSAPPPVISPTGGSFPNGLGGYALVVTVTDDANNATIYYTTDGSTPTTSSSVYTSPINIIQTTTVNAIAVAPGYLNSNVTSDTFTVLAEVPGFQPVAGTYVGAQTVTLSDNDSGSKIYYTTNGTTPTTSSTRYTSPLTVSSTETINAIATATGFGTSPMSSATYTITSVPAVPTITPVGGSYPGTQLVTISDSSLNATVYYTVTPGTTGTTPTTSSSQYSGALTIGSTETVEAIAAVSGYSSSSAASATYTIASNSTATALTLTSGGVPTSSIAIGAPVTLTATVTSSGSPISGGTVLFCDATATHCTDIHVLGSGQVNSAGIAKINLSPGLGSHSYKAVYTGTHSYLSSTSSQASLSVTGLQPSFTTFSLNQQNQTLNATVWAMGNLATAPSGTITFVDASQSNAQVASATLTPQLNTAPQMTAQPQSITLPGNGIAYQENNLVVSGDFNEDGKQDIAVIYRPTLQVQGIVAFLGNGDGIFTQAATAPIPVTNGLIVSGDFNNDGHLDVAVASAGDLTILLGRGDGTFTLIPPATNGCAQVQGIASADFNKDGKLDIAVDCEGQFGGSDSVFIFEGNGDGTFRQAVNGPISLPSIPDSMVAGDFNNDGIPDLAISGWSGTITILLGNGDGTFTQPSTSPISLTTELTGIIAADFNEDGNLDLAVGDIYTGQVVILPGNGAGNFTQGASYGLGASGPYSLAVGDFNGDGHADVAVTFDPYIYNLCNQGSACNPPNKLEMLIGDGTGNFPHTGIAYPQGQSQSAIFGDFNGDGLSDLALLNFNAYGTEGQLSIFLGNTGPDANATANLPSGVNITDAFSASYGGDTNFQGGNSSVSPSLTSLMPAQGVVGQVIKLIGSFGSTVPVVTFNGTIATVNGWTASQIDAIVPPGATSGPVIATVNGNPSVSQQFTVSTGPVITAINPEFGAPGNNVTISGNNFDSAATVSFNGVSAAVTSWNSEVIVATVPAGAGTVPVVVTDDGLQSNSYNFTIGPLISALSPYQGVAGTQVTITGSGFGSSQGTSGVTFNGVPATPTSWGNTSITVSVPSNATSGNVAVQVSGVTADGPPFTVPPTLSGLLPSAGPVGTQVTISGAGFGVNQGSSTLSFGSISATPVSWSVDRIVAAVPSGAVTGPVAVAVAGQVSNTISFTVGSSTSTGTISGTVTQSSGGAPISGATIMASGNGSTVAATSNSSGNYTIPNLSAATYNVFGSAYGYSLGSQSNVSVSSGNTSTVNFALSNQTTISYAYDEANRLIGVSSSSQGGAGYAYDPVGNILSISTYTSGQVAVFGFSPISGPVGTTVTIYGAGFSSTLSQDTVKFGTTVATIVSATPTQIVVTVPSGAPTGPITVTSPGGTTTSGTSFTVTSGSYLDPSIIPGFDRSVGSPVLLALAIQGDFGSSGLFHQSSRASESRQTGRGLASTARFGSTPDSLSTAPDVKSHDFSLAGDNVIVDASAGPWPEFGNPTCAILFPD